MNLLAMGHILRNVLINKDFCYSLEGMIKFDEVYFPGG